MMFHALPALAGSQSTTQPQVRQTLGTYYHATTGNQGELGGLERMMELGRKELPKKNSE